MSAENNTSTAVPRTALSPGFPASSRLRDAASTGVPNNIVSSLLSQRAGTASEAVLPASTTSTVPSITLSTSSASVETTTSAAPTTTLAPATTTTTPTAPASTPASSSSALLETASAPPSTASTSTPPATSSQPTTVPASTLIPATTSLTSISPTSSSQSAPSTTEESTSTLAASSTLITSTSAPSVAATTSIESSSSSPPPSTSSVVTTTSQATSTAAPSSTSAPLSTSSDFESTTGNPKARTDQTVRSTATAHKSPLVTTYWTTEVVSGYTSTRLRTSTIYPEATDSGSAGRVLDDTNKQQGSSLSTGGKIAIGVVIPVVAIAALLGVLAVYYSWRRRNMRTHAEATPTNRAKVEYADDDEADSSVNSVPRNFGHKHTASVAHNMF